MTEQQKINTKENQATESFVVSFIDEPGFNSKTFQHPEFEIIYVIESSGTRTIGDSTERFDEGDMVLIGPNVHHAYKSDPNYYDPEKSNNKRAKAISVQFRKDFWGAELLNLPEMHKVKALMNKADRGIKFAGHTNIRLQNLMYSLKTSEGSNRIILLLEIFRTMALSPGYEVLASEEYGI